MDLEAKARRVREATGAGFPSMDAARFPAWWFDALSLIETIRVLEHNARVEAEINESR